MSRTGELVFMSEFTLRETELSEEASDGLCKQYLTSGMLRARL
jgi:hypothetical protein